MRNLKWIHTKHQWIAKYRNRFTGNSNKFVIQKSSYSNGYWLVWNTPISNKSVNTFRRLKNAKKVAELIVFG